MTSDKNKLICFVFFLSGFSALVFETIWFRVASLVLGSSVWSAAAVLMAFMCGLALGNAIMAARGYKIKNLYRFYIAIELAIGLSGVAVVYFMPKLSTVIAVALGALLDQSGFLNISRFCIAFFILLVPAVAMGTTLPVLQKLIHQQGDSFSSSLGRLYGWNTIGALLGVVLTELLLVKHLGITGSALTACLLNFTAALLVLRNFENSQSRIAGIGSDLQKKLTAGAAKYLLPPFMVGFTLLALEIIWFRYLLLSHDGNSTTFAIMLAMVLCGIGIGGLIIARIKPQSDLLIKLQIVLPLAAAFFTVISFYLFSVIFDAYFDAITFSFSGFILAASLLILPTSVISGMLFPLYGEMLFRQNASITLSSGALTFINTLGAALGAGLATFVLLPKLGIEKSIIVLSAAYVFTGLFFYLYALKHPVLRRGLYLTSTLSLFAITFALVSGTVERTYHSVAKNFMPGWKLVKMHEGLNETLGYFRIDSFGKPLRFTLLTNNHSMSGTNTSASRYMKLYAYFPYLVHKNIRSVLQISYGVGNTAEAVIRLDTVEKFDVVDLSKEVLELSPIIHDATGMHPLKDKRTRVYVEDGRFFLQTTRNQYDLITAEPPPPKHAGVTNLYSREYFQLIHDKLNDGGMVTYWLPGHDLYDADALAIIRAFCDVFDDCSLWNGAGLNFMLVGAKGGLKALTDSEFRAGWNSVIKDDLASIGFEAPGQLGATFLADSAILKRLTSNTAPLTDNFPQRISPDVSQVSQYTGLHAHLLNTERRKLAYLDSQYIRNIFSEKTMQDTAQYFKYEEALTALWVPAFRDSSTTKFVYLDILADNLAMNNHKFLPTVMLRSSPLEQTIIKNTSGEITKTDDFKIAHIRHLLINRDFKRAEADALEYVLSRRKNSLDYQDGYQYYLLAKALNHEAHKAALYLRPDPFSIWYSKRFLSKPAN